MSCNEVRVDIEDDAALHQRFVRLGNVGDLVIQERGALVVRSLRFTQHEADPVQIEERHTGRGLEQEANT